MVRELLRSRIVFCALFASLSASCASVKVSMPNGDNQTTVRSAASSERVALKSAASNMADNPWSDTSVSMLERVLGKARHGDAVDAYLETLEGDTDAQVTAVFSDADDALARARRVAEAGRQAVTAISPIDSDIDTLEKAIADVRQCRAMYTRALERLAKRGGDVSANDIRVVRDAFSQTIVDIGYTADVVASRVRDTQQREEYAQPGAVSSSVGGQ